MFPECPTNSSQDIIERLDILTDNVKIEVDYLMINCVMGFWFMDWGMCWSQCSKPKWTTFITIIQGI